MTTTQLLYIILGYFLGQLTLLGWLSRGDWWRRRKFDPPVRCMSIRMITGITENRGGA